jgi:hypothetical protein
MRLRRWWIRTKRKLAEDDKRGMDELADKSRPADFISRLQPTNQSPGQTRAVDPGNWKLTRDATQALVDPNKTKTRRG